MEFFSQTARFSDRCPVFRVKIISFSRGFKYPAQMSKRWSYSYFESFWTSHSYSDMSWFRHYDSNPSTESGTCFDRFQSAWYVPSNDVYCFFYNLFLSLSLTFFWISLKHTRHWLWLVCRTKSPTNHRPCSHIRLYVIVCWLSGSSGS